MWSTLNMIYKVEIQARKWLDKNEGLGIEIQLNLTHVMYQLLASRLQPEKRPDWKFQGFFYSPRNRQKVRQTCLYADF